MPKSNKTEQSIYESVCWVSVFITFSAPPQFWLHRQFFFCPIPETKEMMGDGFFGATAAGLF